MSHTNSTTNFGLPQFITTDKPAWLTDVNVAYAAIDTAMKNNQTAAASAQGDATQALTDAGNAQTAANTADAKGTGAIASIAPAFLDSSTYNVGDLVMYNSLLYVCTVAVGIPGPWTGNLNWTRTDVDSQIPTTLSTLKDVIITSPSNGQVLTKTANGWENKTDSSVYHVGETISGIFDMSGFIGGNNLMYGLPVFRKGLHDDITNATVTIQNDNKISIYRVNGDALTTTVINCSVQTYADGFRFVFNYPNNTFGAATIGTPVFIVCTLSITFS